MFKKTNVVLSFDNDRKKSVTAFFVLLLEVDKRMKTATKNKKAKEAKLRKNRKTKKDNDTGSLICGPFLFYNFFRKTLVS